VTTEEAARAARVERQLSVTQQLTHIGSWEWDVATNGVTWSDELYRIYGLEPKSIALTFETFLARVHPEDRERITREVRGALATGGSFAYPERIIRPDGSIRKLDTRGEATRDANGAIAGLVGTCRDVTAERKREETLTLFEDIVHNVQIGLVVLQVADPKVVHGVRLISFNPAAEAMAHRPLFEMLGKTLREIVPFAAGGAFERLVLEVASDGVVREATVLRSRDPKDPNRAVSMKAFPLPAYCVGVAIDDISEQARSRRMRDAQARILEMLVTGKSLRAVLDAIVEAVDGELPGSAPAIVLFENEGVDHAGARTGSCAPGPSADDAVVSCPIVASNGRRLGALALRLGAANAPDEWKSEMVVRATRIAGIAIERRQLEEQLHALSQHVETVREEERAGIAREIHDELGQGLTALKMDIAWLGRRGIGREGTGAAAIRDHLQGMSRLTDEIIQQVRRISAELRPGVLDDLGLLAALEWQSQEFTRRTGTPCTIHSSLADVRLGRRVSTGLFRIFQEALTNVARHAHAKHVEVTLERGARDSADTDTGDGGDADGGEEVARDDGDWIELRVRDDGVGIDLALDTLTSMSSLGLLGIRERARSLGGSASIVPAPGGGTLLTLRVPCAEGPERAR
jgi:PAS domain S-box-containing protein